MRKRRAGPDARGFIMREPFEMVLWNPRAALVEAEIEQSARSDLSGA